MNLFSKLVVTAVISALLLVSGIFAGEKLNQPIASSQVSFGSFAPVQGSTYSLQGAGVTATQTTVPLASFTTPDGRAITMAMFGGTIGYGTLEPNTNSKIEDITFSGVTQNSNGSATLTGVTRGNDFVTPYNASTTLAKAHAGGSYFILSNTAGFYGQQFLFANNTSTSTAVMVFSSTTPPRYDADPIWGNFTTQVLADVSYVNSVVAAGAANGSETVKGIYQLATAAQAALGTSVGSTGARLSLGNNLATSTPGLSTIQGDIPSLGNSGFLAQGFLNLIAGWTFSTTTSYFANIGTLTATSSARLPSNTTIGGLPALTTSYVPVKYTFININSFTTSNNTANGTVYATSTDSLTIPAGALAASSTITVQAIGNNFCGVSGGGTATCTLYLRDSLGETLASCTVPSSGASVVGIANFSVFNQSSVSSQKYVASCLPIPTVAANYSSGSGTSAVNTSSALTLFLVGQIVNASVGVASNMIFPIFSIVVNP